NFVPVSLISSRNTQSRRVSGGASTLTSLPLSRNEVAMRSSIDVSCNERSTVARALQRARLLVTTGLIVEWSNCCRKQRSHSAETKEVDGGDATSSRHYPVIRKCPREARTIVSKDGGARHTYVIHRYGYAASSA